MASMILHSLRQLGDANGVPYASAKIYVYEVNTTTKRDIFSDAGLTAPADNPIICPNGVCPLRYTDAGVYKVSAFTSENVPLTQYSGDYLDPGVPLGSGALAVENGGTGADSAEVALSNLGGADAAQVADLAAEVASLSGSLGSVEKTHIATGSTAQEPDLPIEGDIRRDTTLQKWRGYVAAWWDFFTTQDVATQSDQETGTSLATVVTPGKQHFHKSAVKAWGYASVSGTTLTNQQNYNGSFTRDGVGVYTFTFTTAQSAATYCPMVASAQGTDSGPRYVHFSDLATGSFKVRTFNSAGSAAESAGLAIAVLGDL